MWYGSSMLDYDEAVKRWAANKLKIQPDEIKDFDFDFREDTCEYGTCHYKTFYAEVWLKAGGFKEIEREPSDVIREISTMIAAA